MAKGKGKALKLARLFNTKTLIGFSSLAIAFGLSTAFLNDPRFTTQPLDEFMKDNNVPAAMVEDMKTDHIRVYRRGGPFDIFTKLSALHAALHERERAQAADKNQEKTLAKLFKRYKDGYACVNFANFKNPVINLFGREQAKEKLAQYTNIPIEDLNVSDQQLEAFYLSVFVHEVAHPQQEDYADISLLKNKDEVTLSGEITADFRAIESIEKHYPNQSVLFKWRSVRAFEPGYGGDHGTARYVKAMFEKDSADWPTLQLRKNVRTNLPLSIFVNRYDNYKNPESEKIPAVHCTYMGALKTQPILKFLTQQPDHDKAEPEDSIRLEEIEMFIDGYESLVKPEKVKEIRSLKDSIDAHCDPIETNITYKDILDHIAEEDSLKAITTAAQLH